MKLNLILFFLGASILFYSLFGGADFGAGILETFTGKSLRKEQRELITHAMGPVWEANHMWLILAVVILFNGFPKAYSQISTTFHIPLTLMLIGIILRGCSFTFRHYDAIQDRSQEVYSLIFRFSSFITPFFLGTIAGGLIFGSVPSENSDFMNQYVRSWFNFPCVLVGLFVCTVFAFVAAVYLVGESRNQRLRSIFITRALYSNSITIVLGGLVFGIAYLLGYPLSSRFFSHPLSLGCMVGATLFLVPLWIALKKHAILGSRILVAAQIGLVILGWFEIQFPTLLSPLTFYNTAAPDETLDYLLSALLFGSVLIFPALFYLFFVFKSTKPIQR